MSNAPPTLLWGMSRRPGWLLIGRHVGNDWPRMIKLLAEADVIEVCVDWPLGANEESRKRLLEADSAAVIIGRQASSFPPEADKHDWQPEVGSVWILGRSLREGEGPFVGVYLGDDIHNASRTLSTNGARLIEVESNFKMLTETSEEISKALTSAGLRVESFWTPSATKPSGRVDLRSREE